MRISETLLLLLVVLGAAVTQATEHAPTPSKIIELIQKRNYESFIKEMGGAEVDPNQPDSKGRLPLIEAVKTRQLKFVDALLQFFAAVQIKEPSSGASPIHFAFQGGLVDIAKLLLQYGANLNVTDKNGKKPRDFTPVSELKEMIKSWDERGPMAFEDEPGAWAKSKTDKGDTYWYNSDTSVARWNLPPTCAWQRVLYQGHPSHYVNQVTGQNVYAIPPALSWRKVKQEGSEPLWYNWALNMSQHETPDELPDDMLAEEEGEMFNARWYNSVTREFAWVDPKYHTTWREIKDDDGKIYYYNVETGESTWDVPTELAWTQVESSEEPGEFFYHNSVTQDSSWEKPHVKAWELHKHDFEVGADEAAEL